MNGGRVPIVIIAAVAENGVVGCDNRLPWRLPSDLKRFKAQTMGCPVIMGRKTFQSIGKPLPGRHVIVLTRGGASATSGTTIAGTFEEALREGQDIAALHGAPAVFVAGGADIYAQAMDHADRLDITHVALTPEGDARFPVIDPAIWAMSAEDWPARAAGDEAPFAFRRFERCNAAVDRTGNAPHMPNWQP